MGEKRNKKLFAAIDAEDLEAVQQILSKGADIQAHLKSNRGRTPLNHAVLFSRNTAIPAFLISKGANVNAKDGIGSTVLHTACRTSQVELVKLLIESGAELRITNDCGETPLSIAQEEGDKDIINLVQHALAKLEENELEDSVQKGHKPLNKKRMGR